MTAGLAVTWLDEMGGKTRRHWRLVSSECRHEKKSLPAKMAPMQEIRGERAKTLIADQIAQHSAGIAAALAGFDPVGTGGKLHATIKAIEEFINVPLFGLDEGRLLASLRRLPLDARLLADPSVLQPVLRGIAGKFGGELAGRYARTILQVAAINLAFRQHGWTEFGRGLMLATVEAAVAYLQSRRRHLVAMLYSVPGMCKGTTKIALYDIFNVFLPQIEMSGVSLTGLHRQAVPTVLIGRNAVLRLPFILQISS